MSEIQPNQTLHLGNLPSNISIDELKASLYGLFVTFGEIIDISKTTKMRGQAFVVFENTAAATAALRSLNGFMFYNRAIKIEYAKSKSHAIAKLDGTFRLRTTEKKKESGSTMSVLGKRTTDDKGDSANKASRTTNDSSESDDDE